VRAADVALWFGRHETPGGRDPLDACRDCHPWKPFLIICQGVGRPSQAVGFIEAKGVRVLNVAGNRESRQRGIGRSVERFLRDVFRRLGHTEADRAPGGFGGRLRRCDPQGRCCVATLPVRRLG
jgi:hypothetical protein